MLSQHHLYYLRHIHRPTIPTELNSFSDLQIHPITTARLSVNFKHRHLDENITGSVWCDLAEATQQCRCELYAWVILHSDTQWCTVMHMPWYALNCELDVYAIIMQLYAVSEVLNLRALLAQALARVGAWKAKHWPVALRRWPEIGTSSSWR